MSRSDSPGAQAPGPVKTGTQPGLRQPGPAARWTELSENPNSPAVQQWRAQMLAQARSARLIGDRLEHLCGLARGRTVLDIGCVEHFAGAAEDPRWLHGHLARVSARCLGVDILPEPLERLRAKGYDVRLADVVAEPLPERFEVIICGEIIEHIGAPGALFHSAGQMLAPGGVLALTTPYPWYFGWLVKNFFSGPPPVGSVDHVAWFDPCTLAELAERHGLRLRFYAGVRDHETSAKLRAVKAGLGLLTRVGMRPEVLSRSLLYEFERTTPAG